MTTNNFNQVDPTRSWGQLLPADPAGEPLDSNGPSVIGQSRSIHTRTFSLSEDESYNHWVTAFTTTYESWYDDEERILGVLPSLYSIRPSVDWISSLHITTVRVHCCQVYPSPGVFVDLPPVQDIYEGGVYGGEACHAVNPVVIEVSHDGDGFSVQMYDEQGHYLRSVLVPCSWPDVLYPTCFFNLRHLLSSLPSWMVAWWDLTPCVLVLVGIELNPGPFSSALGLVASWVNSVWVEVVTNHFLATIGAMLALGLIYFLSTGWLTRVSMSSPDVLCTSGPELIIAREDGWANLVAQRGHLTPVEDLSEMQSVFVPGTEAIPARPARLVRIGPHEFEAIPATPAQPAIPDHWLDAHRTQQARPHSQVVNPRTKQHFLYIAKKVRVGLGSQALKLNTANWLVARSQLLELFRADHVREDDVLRFIDATTWAVFQPDELEVEARRDYYSLPNLQLRDRLTSPLIVQRLLPFRWWWMFWPFHRYYEEERVDAPLGNE